MRVDSGVDSAADGVAAVPRRKRLPIALAILLAVFLTIGTLGCSASDGKSEAGTSHEKKAPEGTFKLPNGRNLYLKCLGSGSPTVVLEPGENTPGSAMQAVQDPLARRSMACAYDRANVVSSGTAPTPRTAAQIR